MRAAAYGQPTDAALAANDAIEDRAQRYKRLKVRPDARLDQLRVLAFLDILNGITLETRLAQSRADTAAAQQERSAAAGQGGPPERGPDGAPADGGNPAGAVDSGAPDEDRGAYDWDAYFGDHGEPDDEVPGDSVADPGGSAASGPDGPVNGASGAPGGGYRDRSGGMDLAGLPAQVSRTTTGSLATSATAANPSSAHTVPALMPPVMAAALQPPCLCRRWPRGPTSPSRSPPCSAWPNGPAPDTRSAPSTPRWSATSPPLPRTAQQANGP